MERASTINEKWKLCAFSSFLGCLLLTLYVRNNHSKVPHLAFRNITISLISSTTNAKSGVLGPRRFFDIEKPLSKTKGDCNVFEGKWVYTPMQNPFYEEKRCPFLSDQVSCQRNGRPDFGYRGWSWEATDCNIPRFDGKDMLERLRGKRVIIVGDSLNRNQWESLACLLYSAIHPSTAHVDVTSGHYKVFKAKDYNCTVEFYWSPFLVQLDKNNENSNKILRLEKLSPAAEKWKGADIMVFNSGHWWIHSGKLKAWDLFHYKGALIKDMENKSAFEIAMKTWARWVDQNVNPNKTTVFFRSISPEHKGENWCYNVTAPIMDEKYRQTFPKPVIDVVERTIKEMRTRVKYLNITKLSEYRRDAHPTVYSRKSKIKMEKQTERLADCSHWCLPGLPDTWNRLLYALLVFDTSSSRDIISTSLDVV